MYQIAAMHAGKAVEAECMLSILLSTPTRWNRTTGPLSPYGFEVRTPRQRRSGRQKHVAGMLRSVQLLHAADEMTVMSSRVL